MRPLLKDTTIEVQVYHIEDVKSSPRQYEMHHMNTDIKLETTLEKINFRKGDIYIPMNQAANRFILEALEPQGGDSYFAWNFFDGILGQKEGFSAYVFEDIAAAYLQEHAELKTKLEERKAGDSAFAKSARAQLDFIFKNSPFYEPAHMRYPVYRIIK